jgi:hypothetical protein
MRGSIEIVLRGVPDSDELERCIGDEARKLARICDGILTWRVVVQALPRPKQQQGVRLAVALAITLPGTEVVVNREHGEDARIAVRDAFAAAGLQLEDHARRQNDKQGRFHGENSQGKPGRPGR